MILVVTDGVGLTTEIAKSIDQAAKKKLFHDFYKLQLDALSPYACLKKHWKIIKTTGDGLILGVDEHCKCNGNKTSPYQKIIDAIFAMYKNFEGNSLQIRCVCHSTSQTVKDIDIHHTKYDNLLTSTLFKDDIFGLEVIRLMRIAAIVKGPFWIITKDFLRSLLSSPDTEEQIQSAIATYNRANDKININSDAIPLPYLKGFEQGVMQQANVVNLRNPYFVWEVNRLA